MPPNEDGFNESRKTAFGQMGASSFSNMSWYSGFQGTPKGKPLVTCFGWGGAAFLWGQLPKTSSRNSNSLWGGGPSKKKDRPRKLTPKPSEFPFGFESGARRLRRKSHGMVAGCKKKADGRTEVIQPEGLELVTSGCFVTHGPLGGNLTGSD